MQAGTKVRFFSQKVFGAWVDGTIRSITKKVIVIDADFYGNRWTERLSLESELYYPRGHRLQGESFKLETYQAN